MELTITVQRPELTIPLFGPADVNLRLIRELCGVTLTARDGRIRLKGKKDSVIQAAKLLEAMQNYVIRNKSINKAVIMDLVTQAARGVDIDQEADAINVFIAGRTIVPRTEGQRKYIESVRKNDLVFCAGPAGTGKTYLAVAMAVSMLKRKLIRRIVLARPAVEAGEKLGFLPGDMQAKVNPYLRPLFDALGDMMNYEQVRRFMQDDVIEVVPLAFMRGRTLNEAAVILDEAQNTTVSQMLMFLTRMGHDTKMIVTGDASQTDLNDGRKSGLRDAFQRLRGIKGIGRIQLNEADIVRHRLVQSVVKAYGDFGNG